MFRVGLKRVLVKVRVNVRLGEGFDVKNLSKG